MQAVNAGVSVQTATAEVTIYVARNQFGPQFTRLNYDTTIEDTLALGSNILNISASDSDNVSETITL